MRTNLRSKQYRLLVDDQRIVGKYHVSNCSIIVKKLEATEIANALIGKNPSRIVKKSNAADNTRSVMITGKTLQLRLLCVIRTHSPERAHPVRSIMKNFNEDVPIVLLISHHSNLSTSLVRKNIHLLATSSHRRPQQASLLSSDQRALLIIVVQT